MTPTLLCEPRPIPPPANAVLVDDCSHPGGAMVIDHHRGHTTPKPYCRGRTATERVIRALEDGLDPTDFSAAMIRHYDADGALSVWSLQNPERARANASLLIAAAEYGDFFETTRPDPDREALKLSLAVQEAENYEVQPRLKWHFSQKRKLAVRYEYGLNQINRAVTGQTVSVHAEGIVRQIEEEAYFEVLCATPVPVLRLTGEAMLHSIVAAAPNPIVITARPAANNTGRWAYSIILRPQFSWGYSEDAVGPIAFRSMDGLAADLARFEHRGLRSIARWQEQAFDDAIWRIETSSRGSRLTPELLSARVEDWQLERIHCLEMERNAG